MPPSSEVMAQRLQALPAVPLCARGPNSSLQPASDIGKAGFTWTPITTPQAATRYAARLSRAEGSGPAVVVADKLLEAGEPLLIMAERQAGARYEVRVVAMKGDTPICSINGGAS